MTNENKLRIGKFIGIFRRFYDSKTRGKKWSAEKFVCYNREKICSLDVLEEIENGGIYPDDTVYERLLHNLDMKFVQCDELDQSLDHYYHQFYEAVKFCKRAEADEIIQKIKSYPESKNAYYKQVAESMEFIVDFEFDNKVTGDLKYYLTLAECVDSVQLSSLLLLSVYVMNNETELKHDIMNQCVRYISQHNLNDEVYLEFKLLSFQYNRYIMEAYKYQLICCDIYKSVENLTKLYIMSINTLYNETVIGQVRELTSRIIELKKMGESFQLSKRQYISTNLMYAQIYYADKDFSNTLESINAVLKEEPRAICKMSPYYFSSMENLGIEIHNLDVERIYLEKIENHYFVFYRYYMLKHVDKVSNIELLKYLMKRVIPAINIGVIGLETIRIFELEVKRLAESTRNYRSLLDFRSDVVYLN